MRMFGQSGRAKKISGVCDSAVKRYTAEISTNVSSAAGKYSQAIKTSTFREGKWWTRTEWIG